MKRNSFIASSVALLSACVPSIGKTEARLQRAAIATRTATSQWPKPAWSCDHAVVWLDIPSNVYYRKGQAVYGRTSRGAYTCEQRAIEAGNRAS